MSFSNGYQKYKKVDIKTASQNKLVIMLYDGAIKFLEIAISSLDKKYGIEETHNNILKAQEIIYELLSSLNYEAGEIAERLAAIYTYMTQKLTEGNISKTKPPLLEVIKHLKELKTAWESVEEKFIRGESSVNSIQSSSITNSSTINNISTNISNNSINDMGKKLPSTNTDCDGNTSYIGKLNIKG